MTERKDLLHKVGGPILAISLATVSAGADSSRVEAQIDSDPYCITDASDSVFYSPQRYDSEYQDDEGGFVTNWEKGAIKSLINEYINLAQNADILSHLDNGHEDYFQIYSNKIFMDAETGELITPENDYPTREKKQKGFRLVYYYYPEGVDSGNEAKIAQSLSNEIDIEIDGIKYFQQQASVLIDMNGCLDNQPLYTREDAREAVLEQFEIPSALGDLDIRDSKGGLITMNSQIVSGNISWSLYLANPNPSIQSEMRQKIGFEIGKHMQLDLFRRIPMDAYRAQLQEQEMAKYKPDSLRVESIKPQSVLFDPNVA